MFFKIFAVNDQDLKVSVYTVLLNSLLMAGMSGLGAVPFLFISKVSKSFAGLSSAVASGVMLSCSFGLIREGEPYGPALTALGVLLGVAFVIASQSYLEKYEDIKFGNFEGASARKVLLILSIMAAHAIGEGFGVGVSYAGNKGKTEGLLVTLAIGLHNIPEGLAVSTVLISRGVSARRAVIWSILTALPQALFAAPAFVFVEVFAACLPLAVGFAAGCMIWVVFSELIPDALANIKSKKTATTTTIAICWLEILRMTLSSLEKSDGIFPLQSASEIHSIPFYLMPLLYLLQIFSFTSAVFLLNPHKHFYLIKTFLLLQSALGLTASFDLFISVPPEISKSWCATWFILGFSFFLIIPKFLNSKFSLSGNTKKCEDTEQIYLYPDPPPDLPIVNFSHMALQSRKTMFTSGLTVSLIFGIHLGLSTINPAFLNGSPLNFSIISPFAIQGVVYGLLCGFNFAFLNLSKLVCFVFSVITVLVPIFSAFVNLQPITITTLNSFCLFFSKGAFLSMSYSIWKSMKNSNI